uniref:Zgc:174935 n=1 Tax=Oreochromis niloticus TaxID=8128 RepID=A0A669E314_ORENI
MKPQFLLPATVVVSVALVGIMKLRKGEHEKYEKQFKFQDVRLRVANDVLGEYQNDKAEKQNISCVVGSKERKDFFVCFTKLLLTSTPSCNLVTLTAEQEKEKTSWTTEEDTLKQQLEKHSLVCQFIKTDIAEARYEPIIIYLLTLCGIKEQPKAEAPKQDQPKAEAPKQEEPKAEAPKQEEPKAEAPKQEDQDAV